MKAHKRYNISGAVWRLFASFYPARFGSVDCPSSKIEYLLMRCYGC